MFPAPTARPASWFSGDNLRTAGSTAVDGAALVGKVSEVQGLVVSHLICLPPVCIGLYILLRPIRRTERTKGRVTEKPACTAIPATIVAQPNGTTTTTGPRTECSVSVAFTSVRDNQTYTFTAQMEREPAPGETVDVWYDPNNPTDAGIGETTRTIGWFLLVPFGCYLIYRWIKLVLVFKFRWFAAVEGVGDVRSMLR